MTFYRPQCRLLAQEECCTVVRSSPSSTPSDPLSSLLATSATSSLPINQPPERKLPKSMVNNVFRYLPRHYHPLSSFLLLSSCLQPVILYYVTFTRHINLPIGGIRPTVIKLRMSERDDSSSTFWINLYVLTYKSTFLWYKKKIFRFPFDSFEDFFGGCQHEITLILTI